MIDTTSLTALISTFGAEIAQNSISPEKVGTIAAYCFFDKEPAIDVEFVNDGHLSLF